LFVIKRNGQSEAVQFDKILFRVRAVAESVDTVLRVDSTLVAQKVVSGLFDGIQTTEIDTLIAETAAVMTTEHPDYSRLASRVAISNLHKATKSFYQTMKDLFKAGVLSGDFTKLVKLHGKALEKHIDYNRDFDLDFFGFKTLEKSYLLKLNGKVVERPQHLFMRVALQVSGDSFDEMVETYEVISKGMYTHATPTLFNSGALRPQLASCFVGGTPVFTANRGVVPIEAVQIGDEVATHRNRFKPVTQLHVNDLADRQLFSIKCYRTPKMEVTGNHKFWSLTKEQEKWGESPTWNALEHLRVGDFIAMPSCELPDLNLTFVIPGTPPGSFVKLSRAEFAILVRSIDGCVIKAGEVHIQLTNTKLCTQLFHIGRSLGIPLSLSFHGAIARLIIPNHSDSKRLKCINGQFFLRLDAKTKSNKRPEKVYTLGVEDDHSYMVNGLLAENCFLMEMTDSIDGIYDALKEVAQISKYAGGIGIHIHGIRANKSLIKGTNGRSTGLTPTLKPLDATARFVNQGGKRKGSVAIYLEVWHADIYEFLDLRKNTGMDNQRCRDLFLALWVCDLFMQLVEDDGVWHLMSPDECPGLPDVYGEEFETLYNSYVQEGKFRKKVKARALMTKIVETMIECGVPYFLFKDSVNRKSNQKNIGIIKSSNLCTEIMEVSTPNEIAVCNLCSFALPKYLKDGQFDHALLHAAVMLGTKNLNNVIDRTFYPLKKTLKSNSSHRPIGIGVQGLADVFFLLDIAFDSPEARELNARIFETIYHAALLASCELAEVLGAYSTFAGSPASEGILQFDFWGVTPTQYDWDGLKERIKKSGLRNSLLVAPMPTASTANILGNTECFEAQTSNIYKRSVLAGEYVVINKYLVKKLEALGLWNKDMRDAVISGDGSIQHIPEIPDDVKNVYKTVWEISQKVVIDLAADRGAFIDQSQSMNLFLSSPTVAQLNSALFYGWKRGLKTGMYYLRTNAAMQAQKVTTKIMPKAINYPPLNNEEQLSCSLDNPEDCIACGS